jgi:UDP-3-O-[3-hydroxymyristoyl] glucosamine N-acyltransferase
MPVDTRFFAPLGALSLKTIAELTGSELTGSPDIMITGLSSASNGREGEAVFIQGDAKGDVLVQAGASVCFVSKDHLERVPDGMPTLVTDKPRWAHASLAQALFQPRQHAWTGDAVSSEATIHESAILNPGCIIGPGVNIGSDTVIGANTVIGPGVQIGKSCQIGANVSVFCALIGDDVTLSSGARIGESGFGVLSGPDGMADAPHYGRVILQDGVSIGANSCVDRGAFDDTILGERTKIDNLCQVAHNVQFGRDVLMAAFGGISGSVEVGDGSMLGGRVGIADHVKVGKGVSLAASSGLFRDIEDGDTWGGTPAKPIRQWMRELAWLQKQASNKKKKGDA